MNSLITTPFLHIVHSFLDLQTTGIDISDLSLKYLKLLERGGVEYFGEITIPEGIIERGEIKKEDEFIRVLRSWVSGSGRGLKIKHAAISLPEEKSFLRQIQLPKIKEEDIANAIRWEIEANIPLPLDELIYDFEIIEFPSEHQEHFDILISAFPKSVVESYTRVFKAVGIQPLAIELESQAVVRSLLHRFHRRGPKIIIDIGRNRTGFIIFSGKAIIYTTTVDFGGLLIEDNIVKELKVSREDAIRLKEKVGINKIEYDGKLFLALLPSLSALADELKRAVEYLRTHEHIHEGSELVDKVILVGGAANLLGLPTYLSGVLKIPVETADFLPLISSPKVLPSISREKSLGYATALGLASRKIF